MTYYGQVKNGTLTIKNRRGFNNDLRHFEGCDVEIKVSEKKRKRSLSQNAYIHAVLIPELKNAFNSVGFDDIRTNEQCKDIMKCLFLRTQYVNPTNGEVIESFKNTSELTTFEMSELVEKVIKYAWDNMNYKIFAPNEQGGFF